MMTEPVFFASAEEFRAWLERNHDSAAEVVVGFYKKRTGIQTMTWAESVDEALCFGWIDGIRRRIDDDRYCNRFTPRRPGSNWSAINIARVKELTKQGRMRPAGIAAFERRTRARSAIYSYENRPKTFDADSERRFKRSRAAWTFFTSQAPSYQRTAIFWVSSAKREATRERRLSSLIDVSKRKERLPQLGSPSQREARSPTSAE